jgi:predicted PurR-regulated permease PerM
MRIDTRAFILSLMSLLALALVLFLGGKIFLTFVQPLIWAGILAFLLLPVQRFLTRFLKYETLSAAFICIFVFVLVASIIFPLSFKLAHELAILVEFLSNEEKVKLYLEGAFEGQFLKSFLGFEAKQSLLESALDLATWLKGQLFSFATEVGRSAFNIFIQLLLTFLFLFFILKDAKAVAEELSKGLQFLSGTQFEKLFATIKDSLHAAIYGGILTAVIQGSLGGVGYYLFGAPYPFLFMILTIIAGTIPFTPPLVFVPLGVYVMLAESLTRGAGIILWGFLIVAPSDPLIRPILVGQRLAIPTGLMLIGVLGGVASFGISGIFVGPIIISLLRVFWLEVTRTNSES